MSKRTSKSDPFAERESAKYERPIPSREFILQHLLERKKPASYAELAEELQLATDEEAEIALQRRLKAMVRDNQIEKLRGGFFWPMGNRVLVEGRIATEKQGKTTKAWVIPEDGSSRILLSLEDAYAVYPGNRVIVSTIDTEAQYLREGRLVEIIEQQRVTVTGRFVVEPNFSHVIPHGKDMTQDILVPPGKEGGAKEGQIVVVEITRPPKHWSNPIGNIVEILGDENTPGIEIEAAMRAYNLPYEFNKAVLREAAAFSDVVPEEAKKDRLDLRQLPFVTIDGEDAKDFDDAVYCERRKNGGYRLYVAIADVSAYVKPHTALDKEAQLRGNSVYFPGRVIPMLPEVLSNGLCSLKPDVDRLCLVCIMSMNDQGKLTRYEFQEAVFKSHARLTYTKVAALLQNGNEKLKAHYTSLLPHLQTLNNLYHCLRTEREIRGAIEFETQETRIIFGENGKISRIEPVVRNDAHKIIEECMLAANVACAKFLKKHKIPALYRNHEGPPKEKLLELQTFLRELGLAMGGGKEPEPLDYAKLLRSVQHRKDANVIQTVLLRSLSQAIYAPDNQGHFGLAYSAYCHFTSPIRRYPDLLVHRQIRTVLRGEWTEQKKEAANIEEAKEALASLGDHTSMTERRADDATRDAVRWLKCKYMQNHLGEEFEGIISGVTRFGFFVELKDIYIDGLVHVANLKDDYYYFDPAYHRLVGERSGVIFKLADSVKIKVAKVDIDGRKIDFELIAIANQSKQKVNAKKASPKPKRKKDTPKTVEKKKKKRKRNRNRKKPQG
jgi:ribonuclease R